MGAEGFRDEIGATRLECGDPRLFQRVGGEGNDDRILLPGEGADFARGLAALHQGHVLVHEDQVRLPFGPFRHRVLAVFHLGEREARLSEDAFEEEPVGGLVFRDEDADLLEGRGVSVDALGGPLVEGGSEGGGGLGLHRGELVTFDGEAEDRPLTEDRLDHDVAPHHLDETAGDGKAEPGTLGGAPPALGLRVSFEELSDLVLAYPPSGVADLEMNADPAPGAAVDGLGRRHDLGGDRDSDTALGGEFDGVAHEVDEDLSQLAAVGHDLAGQGGASREVEGDALFAGLDREHLVDRLEEGGEFEALVVEFHLAGFDLG